MSFTWEEQQNIMAEMSRITRTSSSAHPFILDRDTSLRTRLFAEYGQSGRSSPLGLKP